jgi:uncharacterized protein (DUF1778 family)
MTKGYEQRKEANERYLAKQDDIKIRAPKGTKELWKAAADAAGVSMNQFVRDAVDAAISAQESKSAGE